MEPRGCLTCKMREMIMLHLATMISTTRAQAESAHADRADPDDRPHAQFNSLALYLGNSARHGQLQMCCGLYSSYVCITHCTGLDFDWPEIFLHGYTRSHSRQCYCQHLHEVGRLWVAVSEGEHKSWNSRMWCSCPLQWPIVHCSHACVRRNRPPQTTSTALGGSSAAQQSVGPVYWPFTEIVG